MKSSFKVGDKVRLTEDYWGKNLEHYSMVDLPKSHVYTVDKYCNKHGIPRIKLPTCSWYIDNECCYKVKKLKIIVS